MTLSAVPSSEKLPADLKPCLEAAAIPRWCDPAILAILLDLPPAACAERLAALRELALADPSPAHGEAAIRVPEPTRQVLRWVMVTLEPERFRGLSLRLADFFRVQSSPAAHIEWICHLLCGDPERGARELEKLDHDWTDRAHAEERYALAIALRDIEEAGLLTGRARAWVLLAVGWMHQWKGETLQWGQVAEQALGVAREAGDAAAEAEALCLIGDSALGRFQFGEAESAFDRFLSLAEIMTARYPHDTGWQRKLALAHSRLGDVAQARGQAETARNAFAKYLAIGKRLAKEHPEDAGWQREVAVAHSKIGHVHRAQGHPERARGEYSDYLTIFRQLVRLDPNNLGWQRELAIACGLMAQIRLTLDGAAAALPYFEESSRILEDLLNKVPGVAQWAEDKRQIDENLAACRRSTDAQKLVKTGLSWLSDKLPF